MNKLACLLTHEPHEPRPQNQTHPPTHAPDHTRQLTPERTRRQLATNHTTLYKPDNQAVHGVVVSTVLGGGRDRARRRPDEGEARARARPQRRRGTYVRTGRRRGTYVRGRSVTAACIACSASMSYKIRPGTLKTQVLESHAKCVQYIVHALELLIATYRYPPSPGATRG